MDSQLSRKRTPSTLLSPESKDTTSRSRKVCGCGLLEASPFLILICFFSERTLLELYNGIKGVCAEPNCPETSGNEMRGRIRRFGKERTNTRKTNEQDAPPQPLPCRPSIPLQSPESLTSSCSFFFVCGGSTSCLPVATASCLRSTESKFRVRNTPHTSIASARGTVGVLYWPAHSVRDLLSRKSFWGCIIVRGRKNGELRECKPKAQQGQAITPQHQPFCTSLPSLLLPHGLYCPFNAQIPAQRPAPAADPPAHRRPRRSPRGS